MGNPEIQQGGDVRAFFRGLFPSNIDWTRYEPYYYHRSFAVPVIAEKTIRGDITLEEQPHVIYRITHAIIGNVDDPETSGLFRDDQYAIKIGDGRRQYMANPIPASLLFGPESKGSGNLPLLFPIMAAGSRVYQFEIENLYTRTLSPEAETYRVDICMHTMRDIGGTLQDAIR